MPVRLLHEAHGYYIYGVLFCYHNRSMLPQTRQQIATVKEIEKD